MKISEIFEQKKTVFSFEVFTLEEVFLYEMTSLGYDFKAVWEELSND